MTPQIDPNTGEVMQSSPAGVQIDPNTGEVIPPPEPTMLQKAMTGVKDFGIGALKGAGSTMSAADDWSRQHLPAFMTNAAMGFGKPEDIPAVHAMMQPQGTAQSLGKGVEQAAEFMIPGGAEERMLGKAPLLAKVAGGALGAGAVNKAQGGSFTGGAAMGAGGQLVGAGLRSMAPALAEKAIGIRGKFDRSFNKAPGRAILDETTGIRPDTISRQAADKVSDLSGQVDSMADRASVRPNPVRGMLQAPPQEIPLETGSYAGATPTAQGRPSDVMFQDRAPMGKGKLIDAKVNPEEPMEPRSGNPDADISEYPGINPQYLSGSAHPEMSGRFGPSKGVLIRPFEAPEGAPPLAATVPNRVASLRPARAVLTDAMGKAAAQNTEGTAGQLQGMAKTIGRRFTTGEPIPDQVTPRELLDLRRGFNDEHGSWNPELHESTISTGRRTYGALTNEFHNVLPEAAPLDQRISSLIPVKNRAQITALHDSPSQKAFARFGAHTGALTGLGVGSAAGYKEGGVPGAIAGGVTGVLAPELIASPEGQMILARSLNGAAGLRGGVGVAAQLKKAMTQ